MARPTKLRKIECKPSQSRFVPAVDIPEGIEHIDLKIEELEAMRLKDVENLNQEECAVRMKVSRQTFQLIIDEARRKVAIALSEGKAINISGGNYTLNICAYKCADCSYVFETAYESKEIQCPKCASNRIVCMHSDEDFCKGKCTKDCK